MNTPSTTETNTEATEATTANTASTTSTNHAKSDKFFATIKHISDFLTRCRGPFLSFLSYGLILGLATTGLALMAISGLIGLFFDPTTHSGFGFLTGGIMLAVSSTMILWKMTHTLKEINSRKLRVADHLKHG